MEARIRERFSDRIVAEAAGRYGVAAGDMRRLASAESYIYEFEREGRPLILRLSHSLRRTVALIAGEVDWMNYLARGGAAVAPALHSLSGALVEPIDDGAGGHFLATAFVKAPGGRPDWLDETPAFLGRYGQAIGRMHRLTKTYEPAEAAWRRPHWDDPAMQDMVDFFPPSEARARRLLDELVARLGTLPRDREVYGLVHQDAHFSNFFVDEAGELTFFDFDDCAYTWFAADIAIVLFYAATGRDEPEAYTRRFLPLFLDGYRRENDFDPAWLARFPDFLKLRELELYGVIHRSFDVDNLTDGWVRAFMDGRKERIEGERPYLALDFEGLSL